MLGASSSAAIDAVVVAAAFIGPIVAIAIFWFGLRSARRHDLAHPPSTPPKPD